MTANYRSEPSMVRLLQPILPLCPPALPVCAHPLAKAVTSQLVRQVSAYDRNCQCIHGRLRCLTERHLTACGFATRRMWFHGPPSPEENASCGPRLFDIPVFAVAYVFSVHLPHSRSLRQDEPYQDLTRRHNLRKSRSQAVCCLESYLCARLV